jgi:hypothetical protein
MKMKNLLLTIAATFGMTALTMAQNVPNYVPTNGLIGWWPFNGNAIDESGNGNNGTVNGATLTIDRNGLANKAYSFDGVNDFIEISYNSSFNSYPFSINVWVIKNDLTRGGIVNHYNSCSNNGAAITSVNGNFSTYYYSQNGSSINRDISTISLGIGNWQMITSVFANDSCFQYLNGILVASNIFDVLNPTPNSSSNTVSLNFGLMPQNLIICPNDTNYFHNGNIDDIGIWNRALTQQEITDLFNAVNCNNNTTISPQTNSLTTGSTASFTAITSDPNPSYVWQSDFGQGYVTLNNFGSYSGVNTGTLNIANVQLPNHTQPIRVITTSGNCIDTSNVAIISITDTCINIVTDTTFITVTDTLVINTTITSLNPPNNANTIKVFPNPTNDHITIDYGNFSLMNGYQLRIENSLGQQVFQTNITQQSDYLNLTTWGGNGLYFVHIIDPQGNTIDIRKIVLQ